MTAPTSCRSSWPAIIRPSFFGCLLTYSPLRTGMIHTLCYMKRHPRISAYAGILTPRISTTGAERSARFVRTARAGGHASGG